MPSYIESLSQFGLTAMDAQIRKRVLQVSMRDYLGSNVEFRLDQPTDFAVYAQVDIVGPDPNDLGLLGYDNTPGKDVGNERLFDRIGGVNATTQSDGYPGFGGVFTEQFLGFSAHPGPSVDKLPISSPNFDAIFDPLRVEGNGEAVSPSEVANAPIIDDGSICPSGDRSTQIGCAVFVLGNLIGSTLTHEVGHSLGLADPKGDLFHDIGDAPNRLMDSGDARPFEERGQLMGQGPSVFCDDEFTYLRSIMPSLVPDPVAHRPTCGFSDDPM
jgi:hypothetical protein